MTIAHFIPKTLLEISGLNIQIASIYWNGLWILRASEDHHHLKRPNCLLQAW